MKRLLIFLLLGLAPNSAFSQPTKELYRITGGSTRNHIEYYQMLAGVEDWASLGGRSCYFEDLETTKREVVENVT